MQFKEELQESNQNLKSFSSKWSLYFELMFWLKHLIQTLWNFHTKKLELKCSINRFRTIFASSKTNWPRFLSSSLAWNTLYHYQRIAWEIRDTRFWQVLLQPNSIKDTVVMIFVDNVFVTGRYGLSKAI